MGSAASSSAAAALVAQFRGRPLIVLSPHFDDACFSLGGFLNAVGGGALINIFTRGAFLARPDLAHAGIPPDGAYFIRDGEDREFARACGLERHDLGCEEPLLRGRRPSQMSGLADDIGQIEEKLVPLLLELAAKSRAHAALFVPLGIGRHVNHRATTEAVMRNLARLCAAFELFFYEELPYAGQPFHRWSALRRLRCRAGAIDRHSFAVSWHQKRELIGIYQSQLRGAPSFVRFHPAALPLSAHEAFWSLAQKNIKGDTPCSGDGLVSS